MFSNSVRTLGLVATLSTFASACGALDPNALEPTTKDGSNGPVTYLSRGSDSEVEKIIGDNDLIKVNASASNVPAKYRSIIDAFGRISMGCSATHIGNGLVLTAGHCFNAGQVRQKNLPCNGITVQWGLRYGKSPYLTSRCTKVLSAERSDRADFAIFQVSPAPRAQVELDMSGNPRRGQRITIFGHSQGRPLEWSQHCTVQPSPSNMSFRTMDFAHQCDTEPGNSGSTVIDSETLKVVAIHDGGLSPWNYGTFLLTSNIRDYAR